MVEDRMKQENFNKQVIVNKKKHNVSCLSFRSGGYVSRVIHDSHSKFFGIHDGHSLQAMPVSRPGHYHFELVTGN